MKPDFDGPIVVLSHYPEIVFFDATDDTASNPDNRIGKSPVDVIDTACYSARRNAIYHNFLPDLVFHRNPLDEFVHARRLNVIRERLGV